MICWGALNFRRLIAMKTVAIQCQRLVDSKYFEPIIIAIIVANSVLLGLETSKTLEDRFGDQMRLGYQVALTIFIAEAIIKMVALAPRSYRYFQDGWNVFDFLVIVAALIPATGQLAIIARLARLLRALRLISAVKELRLIISALVRSIPSVGHVMVLMGIIVYIYAIMGYHFFHIHDPDNWGSLGLSLLTLFNIITLEGWIEVMATAMELNPYSWIYFVSFVVVGTFVVINLLIAIIINNLDEAKLERLRDLEQPVTAEELLREIRTTRDSLQRLEARIGRAKGLDKGDRG